MPLDEVLFSRSMCWLNCSPPPKVFRVFCRLDASHDTMILSTWDKLGQSADKTLRFISDGADSRQRRVGLCRSISGNWNQCVAGRW